MKIRIDTNPVGPLRVLPELPDAKLAVLEGFNGIGKTLAIRLLQICTGSMPYRTDSAAWKSLKDGLGDFCISATGLIGANEVVWRGDSREWLDGPALGYHAATFESITIDGEGATMEQVRQLLVVERVAGDESLVDTFAQQATAGMETIRAWAGRFAGPEEGPLAAMERQADLARSATITWDLDAYQAKVSELASTTSRLRLAEEAANSAITRRNQLQDAVDLKRKLAEFSERIPGLDERLRELDTKIQETRDAKASLDAEIATLAGKAAMAAPALKELGNARRTLERNRSRLQKAANVAAAAGSPLGIPVNNWTGFQEALDATNKLIKELSQKQSELDSTPAIRNLLASLTSQLKSAEANGLSDQVVIDDVEDEVQLSVVRTRLGIENRSELLKDKPPAPEAKEVSDSLNTATRRRQSLMSLRSAIQDVERFQRLVAQSEERVSNALRAADPEALDRMKSAENSRRLKDDLLIGLAAERAGLQEQLGASGGASVQRSLQAQFKAALSEGGVSADHLESSLLTADQEIAALHARIASTQNASAALRRDISRMDAEVRRATEYLNAPDLEWLYVGIPADEIPDPHAKISIRIAALERIRGRLDGILERMGSLRSQLAAVQSAMEAIAEHLRGNESSSSMYRTELEAWLSERLGEWFNLGIVRDQLLPQAEGTVKVDVADRSVIWREGGAIRRRPIEAFSSGEQAFAYTRARIGILDDDMHRPLNRLIVLDEFGAFISHDRLDNLLSYLVRRVDEHPDDQVLVVLPLSRDYGELAETAIGEEGKRYAALAEQVRNRRFATRSLT